MDIQTLTIIVACTAFALALEATILIWWFSRKTYLQLAEIRQGMKELKEMKQLPKDDLFLRQLVDKLSPVSDFPEDIDNDTETKNLQVEKDDSNNSLLLQAYEVFYNHYQQMAADISVDNLEEKKDQLSTLLLEMGYWLKDFLPVWHKDFNATSDQNANARRIALNEHQWQQELANAPLATTNPYKTPFEVIALVQCLQQWGIKSFRFLLSGFRYQPQNTES